MGATIWIIHIAARRKPTYTAHISPNARPSSRSNMPPYMDERHERRTRRGRSRVAKRNASRDRAEKLNRELPRFMDTQDYIR